MDEDTFERIADMLRTIYEAGYDDGLHRSGASFDEYAYRDKLRNILTGRNGA